jgi:hypothetical protein
MARGSEDQQITGRTLVEEFQEGYAAQLRIDAHKSEIADIRAAIDAATELHDDVGKTSAIVGSEVTDTQLRRYFVGEAIIRAEERRVGALQSRLSNAALMQAVTITPRNADNNPLAQVIPHANSIGGRWTEESRKKPTIIAGTIDSLSVSKNLISVRPQRFNPMKNIDGAYFQTLVLDEHGFPLIDIEVRPVSFRDRQKRTLFDRFAELVTR